MKDSLRRTKSMAMDMKLGLKVAVIRETIMKGRSMAKGCSHGQMALSMMVNIKMTSLTAEARKPFQPGTLMMESGRMKNRRDTEFTDIRKGAGTMDNGEIMKRRERVLSTIQMGTAIKAFGRIKSSKVS